MPCPGVSTYEVVLAGSKAIGPPSAAESANLLVPRKITIHAALWALYGLLHESLTRLVCCCVSWRLVGAGIAYVGVLILAGQFPGCGFGLGGYGGYGGYGLGLLAN